MFLQPDQDFNPEPWPFPMVPPSVDPGGGDLVKIAVNREWLQFVTGAATTLCLARAWVANTDAEMAEIRQKAMDLLGQLNTPLEEPPFYEDDEHAGDETLPEAPWYENLSDWIISAFLALTFTPDAAIIYRATIPKLRLAFRTGDLGAIVRVLLNDLEIWTGSTSAPSQGLLEANLDAEAFAAAHSLGNPPWTLKIIHDGPPGGVDYDDPTYPKGKLEVELGDIRPREEAMQLRQDGCIIQTSTDGENWTTLYDPTDCVDGLIGTAITDAIADGTLAQPGGQPGAGGTLAPSECKTYHVQLAANQVWHSPVPVADGYTITVSNLTGAWSDGQVLWACPQGVTYLLGACFSESPILPDEGDPLQTGNHMQLIAMVGDTPMDIVSAPITVPQATGNVDLLFQANDGSLSDDLGGIEFDLEICAPPAFAWCYSIDFTQDDGDFAAYVGGGYPYAEWQEGVGWVCICNPANQNGTMALNIHRDFQGANFARITAIYDAVIAPVHDGNFGLYHYTGSSFLGTALQVTGDNQEAAWDAPNQSSEIHDFGTIMYAQTGGCDTGQVTLKRMTFWGQQSNPFGTTNCE